MGPGFGPPPIFILVVVVIFVVVIGSVMFKAISGFSEWSSNNTQPERSDEAGIVSKRTEVSGGKNSTYTTYYATFELQGGERKELEVQGSDYGLFAEGDSGRLRHQGTRFLGFERHKAFLKVASRPPETVAPENLVCDYCGSTLPAGNIKCEGCGWTWRPGKPREVDAGC